MSTPPVNDIPETYDGLRTALATIREIGPNNTTLAFAALCSEIQALYRTQLESVPADGLVSLQAKLKQVQAIKDVLMHKPGADGRI